MNKQDLLKKCREQFYFYELSINKNKETDNTKTNTNKQSINNTNKQSVVFETWTKDARKNCYVEIQYNNVKEKSIIYETINKLLNKFDFSFKTTFESVKDINEFIGGY